MEILQNIFTKKTLAQNIYTFIAENWKFDYEQSILEKINHYFKGLKDDLYIYVEYPYVDKIYRDSYYFHFSTKHYQYERNCIRLSLFNEEIEEKDFEYENLSNLQKKFRGFVVLRPIFPKIFGRSIIDPRILKNNNFEICPLEVEVLVNGAKMTVNGFPHSSQDGETIRCAETCIWSVMEYFGNKYPEYSTVLPSKIINVLRNQMYHRQTPSSGLTQLQISYALKELGFGTKLYTRKNSEDLNRIFHSYIESGIPIIAHIEKGDINHAVVYIGQKSPNYNDKSKEGIFISAGNNIEIYDICSESAEYVTIDDNRPPYEMAPFNNPLNYYGQEKYENAKIRNIIVPLYKHIHLEAFQAMSFVESILQHEIIGWKNLFHNKLIIRLFLASSRSFKDKKAKDNSIDSDLKSLIINQTMPKFVWVAEITTPNTMRNQAIGMIIIDATAYNLIPKESFINIIYPEKIILKDEEQIEKETKPFNIYKNLQGGL